MKRILVALDTSPLAAVVLRDAIALAEAMDAKVRVVRAISVPPPAVVPGVWTPVGLVGEDALLAAAAASLRKDAEAIPPDFRDGVIVEVGAPHQVILDAANGYRADLVVIGSHEHGALRRLLGTIAERVVNHAQAPVYVVRPLERAA